MMMISAFRAASTLSWVKIKSGSIFLIFSKVSSDWAVQVISEALNMVPFAKPRAIAPPILPEPIIDILILQIISYILCFLKRQT